MVWLSWDKTRMWWREDMTSKNITTTAITSNTWIWTSNIVIEWNNESKSNQCNKQSNFSHSQGSTTTPFISYTFKQPLLVLLWVGFSPCAASIEPTPIRVQSRAMSDGNEMLIMILWSLFTLAWLFLDRRQSFSGYITQFNIWDFALEDFQIENMATCRSDNWGNIVQSQAEKFSSSQGGYSKVWLPYTRMVTTYLS